MKFKSQSYFDAVIGGFVTKGYTLISQVSITSTEIPYHVTVSEARSTTLVFHKRGIQLIFTLELLEYTGLTIGTLPPEGDICYWILKVHAEHGDWRQVLPLLETPGASVMDERKPMPFFESGLDIDGFYYYGSSGYQQLETKEAMQTGLLLGSILKFLSAIEPFVAKGRFPELSVSFAPDYTFRGCEELFWSRFDVPYLRSIVQRPYGALPFERRWEMRIAHSARVMSN